MSDFRSADPYLAKRYGLLRRANASDQEAGVSHGANNHKAINRAKRKVRSLPNWIWSALIFAVLGGGWLFWSADFHSHPALSTEVISYQGVTKPKVGIWLNYSYLTSGKNVNHRFACLLTASDQSSNIVGQIVDTLPPAQAKGLRKTFIPTTSLATTATIDSCK